MCCTIWQEVEDEYKDMVSEDDEEAIDLETVSRQRSSLKYLKKYS